MSKSSISLADKIKALKAQRRALLSKLTRGQPIIVGNVYDVMRRCGNPSCHCAARPGHRQTLLIYVDDGKRHCKFVRLADVKWVKQAWERYHECKTALREFRALHRRELEVLRVQIQARRVSYK